MPHGEIVWTVALICGGFVSAGVVLGRDADSASRHAPLRAVFDRHVAPGELQLFTNVEGRLRTDASKGPSGVTLNVFIDRIELNGSMVSMAGGSGALIGVGGELTSDRILQWRAGRRVAFPATLRRPTTYLDPGVGDAERQLAWRGVALVGSVKSDRLVEVTARWGRRWRKRWRQRGRRSGGRSRRASAPWSARSAAVVAAILIGDRAGLEADVERRLQEAGTYHVIAISGGNIAILAGLCSLPAAPGPSGPAQLGSHRHRDADRLRPRGGRRIVGGPRHADGRDLLRSAAVRSPDAARSTSRR